MSIRLTPTIVFNRALCGNYEEVIDSLGRNRISEKLLDDLNLYLNHPNARRYIDACMRCCNAIFNIGLVRAAERFNDELYQIRTRYYQEITFDLDAVCEHIHNREKERAIPLIKLYRHEKTRLEIANWLRDNVDHTMDTRTLMKKCGTYMNADLEGQRLGFPFTR